MRAGYASVLVSRSRGAPLLHPATPSRFEPDTRAGARSDDIITGDHADATAEVAHRQPQMERPVYPPPIGQPQPWAAEDVPLLEVRRPQDDRNPVDERVVRDEPRRSVTLDDQHDQRCGIGPIRAPQSGRSAMRDERAVGPSAREPTRFAEDPSALVDSPSAIAWATHEPTSPIEQVVVTRHAEREDPPTDRSSAMTHHDGADPPIIVRIGRLDVRAVQAPPAPRPEARPRRQAGPTLEERLLARDGQ